MLLRGNHYATGQRVELACIQGVIRSVNPARSATVDFEAGWVAPALFDLQINGCDGKSFNSEHLTLDDIRHVVGVCRRHGIGGLCPTLVTNSASALLHGFTTLEQARQSDPDIRDAVPGFHLEGPYISPEDGPRGAHPRIHVRPPDWDEFRRFQDTAGGRIRMVTLAPEVEGGLVFIEKLVAGGVIVAIGHTAASGACIRAAVQAGARLSTHLGNGAHAMLPRHDNYLWEQLAEDALWASLISDGHHLPLPVLRCLLRVKTPARTVLTCDASSLAGLPPGRYSEWGQEFEVRPEGKVIVAGTPYLAGSAVFTDTCVAVATRWAGASLRDAVDMAGARPRELLGLPPRRLEVGDPAEVVLFDHEPGNEFCVRATLRGERLERVAF
jgi:N-acetylglucosamine-6-phosphate deacetylase